MARKGEDPTGDTPTHSDTFKVAVENYIKHEQKGKRLNRSAEQRKASCCDPARNGMRGLWQPCATARSKGFFRSSAMGMPKRAGGRRHGQSALQPSQEFFRLVREVEDAQGFTDDGHGDTLNGARRRERDWFKKQAADNAHQIAVARR